MARVTLGEGCQALLFPLLTTLHGPAGLPTITTFYTNLYAGAPDSESGEVMEGVYEMEASSDDVCQHAIIIMEQLYPHSYFHPFSSSR